MHDFLAISMSDADENPMPPVSKSLLDALEQRFPAKDFTPKDPYREMDFHYGQRSVINLLKHHYNMQNENILLQKE